MRKAAVTLLFLLALRAENAAKNPESDRAVAVFTEDWERELHGAAHPDEPTVTCELRPTRYDLIMKAFGGDGEMVDTLDQTGPAVRRAFESRVPYCLNVNIRGVRSPFTEWRVGAH